MEVSVRKAVGAFPYHTPQRDEKEGNEFGIVFKLLLAAFRGGGYLKHLDKPLPKAALDDKNFHTTYWKAIGQICDSHEMSWLEMDSNQRRIVLHEFMLDKFSLDPWKRVMSPTSGCKRLYISDSKWSRFELSDEQTVSILDLVMEKYEEELQSR